MTQKALKELLEAVEAAIQAGDWKVDGACDPDLVIRRAKKALAHLDVIEAKLKQKRRTHEADKQTALCGAHSTHAPVLQVD